MVRAVLLSTFAVGCVGPWPGTSTPTGPSGLEDPSAGFIYPGPIGDHGWSKSHDDGRLYLEEELGIPTVYHELVLPADTNSLVDQMVAEGTNIVFTTSFDYVSQTQQAASEHPDEYFLSCSGGVHGQNLSSYFGRMYQPIYLAGYLAGKMTCTNRIGVPQALSIPETVRHLDAFTLGVKAANPDAVVDTRWVLAWFDPEGEPAATQELIDAGADVILTATDSTFPVEVVEGQNVDCNGNSSPVWSIGYDNIDGCNAGPERCLTSAYWNWGPLYVELVSEIADGAFDATDIEWRPMTTRSDSVVGLADLTSRVPANVRTEVAELKQAVVAGSTQFPFIGPITDVHGSLRVDDGVEMDDDQLNRICWLVDGIVSSETGEDLPGYVPPGCGGDE